MKMNGKCAVWAVLAVSLYARALCAQAAWHVRGGIENSLKAFEMNQVGFQYVFPAGDPLRAAGRFNHAKRMAKAVEKRFGAPPVLRPYTVCDSWYAQYVPGGRFTSGHLLVLDMAYAMPDFAARPEKAEVELEVLLRQTHRFSWRISRILVYPAEQALVDAYKAGGVPDMIARCERLAAHYNLPSLDLARAAARGNDLGETVDAFMEALFKATPVPEKWVRKVDPPRLNAAASDNCRVVGYDDGAVRMRGAGWRRGQKSPVPQILHVLETARAGDEIEMEFRGTEIGICDVLSDDTPAWEWSLDGGAWRRLAPESAGKGAFKVRNVPLASGLKYKGGVAQTDEDRHVIRLRTASAGVARFSGFLLNGTVADEGFASPRSLDYIDHVYAQMKPVSFAPRADRFRFIPQTVEKLRNGPSLRIVMLGDSIVNDTSSSHYELLLMRRYPACKITKITSVRGSTGCWYYARENRVREWVLNHQPDLVVIGGISNRDDAGSVQSVVQQLRAAKKDIEIMLVTPVFGSAKTPYNQAWTYAIDAEKYRFRADLRDIARTHGCAFFDMTAEWGRYVRASGYDVGWFMRDGVHANDRGKQILGRLLEIWFDVSK